MLNILDATAGRAAHKGAIILKCDALGPLPKTSAACAFSANNFQPGCACPADAAAHPCRLHIFCRPSKPACIVGLRSCLLGSCSAWSGPGPDRPCTGRYVSPLVCMPRRRRIPGFARYTAVRQRCKHLPLHRGADLHDQGHISMVVFTCTLGSRC